MGAAAQWREHLAKLRRGDLAMFGTADTLKAANRSNGPRGARCGVRRGGRKRGGPKYGQPSPKRSTALPRARRRHCGTTWTMATRGRAAARSTQDPKSVSIHSHGLRAMVRAFTRATDNRGNHHAHGRRLHHRGRGQGYEHNHAQFPHFRRVVILEVASQTGWRCDQPWAGQSRSKSAGPQWRSGQTALYR